MKTRMERVSVGDVVSYNSSYSRVGDKIGLVIKKVHVGEWKIISDRELEELAALQTIPKAATKATRMFGASKSAFDYLIILEAKENKMSITYRIVIKNIRNTYRDYKQIEITEIDYKKMELDAKARASEAKKERLKNEIIKVKKIKAAAIKRRKKIREKQGSIGWDEVKLVTKAIKDEYDASLRLQKLLKRSRETIFGREK